MPVEAWLNENVPNATWQSVAQNDDYEIGQRFKPQADGHVTGLRWYRHTTTPADAPVLLRVWDAVSQTVLYTAPTVPDDGAVGWQVHTPDAPPAVLNDHPYYVSQQVPAGIYHAYYALGEFHGPGFPVGLWIPTRAYRGPGTYGFPNVLDYGAIEAIDARVSGSLPEYTWTTTATTTYTETLKWPVPADRYLLEVTTIGEWKSAQIVQGLDVRRLVGFWSPLSGDYAGQRFTVNAIKSQLMAPNNRRMEGLLLDTGPGSAGTVTAQVVSGA